MTSLRLACCGLFLSAATVLAAPPGAIRVPAGPVAPAPVAPAPDPAAALKLTPDLLYVIDSDVPCLVLASPAGLVSVTEEAGPVRVRGRFADAPNKVESRTFKGKAVFTVEAVGTGRVELLVVPVGAAKADQVVRRTVDVDAGQGPIPPPKPGPKPDPKPGPKDVPLAADPAGLRVLIVYDSLEKDMLPGHREVIFGAKVRDWLDANAAKDGYRMWPSASLGDLAGAERHWRDAAARKRESLPYCIISNGKTFYEGPLPADADKFIAEAGKHK